MTDKITPVELKRINRNRIYKLLYDEKGLKRQDIADKLSLSLPTVNQNLKELLEDGMIEFAGELESTGGRKPQVISANANARLTIAVNIRKNYYRIMSINLYGEVLEAKTYEIQFVGNKAYSKELGHSIDEFIIHNKIEGSKLLGVGITIPGIFDRESEKIIVAPTLGIHDYNIGQLTEFIKYKTIVVNDAKASAFTYTHRADNLNYGVYLLVDRGVGGSIICDSRQVRGVNNRAGEIGHMTIVPGGLKCGCGKCGCLESYVSISRLSDDCNMSLEDFFENLGLEKKLYKVFDEYIDNLALGINNIYTIFDAPVIIGGELVKYIGPYLDMLRERIYKLNPMLSEGLEIQLDSMSKKEALTGAALMLTTSFIESV